MKHRLILSALLLGGLTAGAARAGEEPPLADPKPQVEARGPVHEAYAQPHAKDPAPNEPIKQKPPEPVPEEPPEEKPVGENVQWMPGYWHFDDERKDFIWISGFWRNMPKGRRWVVGYWAETNDGWRYVNGHWAADQEPDRQVVPEAPPRNLDEGPSTPAPDDNSLYIPGSWFYTETGWRWRPGYWADQPADQVWIPASYNWSPDGYVFTSGYWDYSPYNRGLLFAPVYWGPRPFFRPGFFFRPAFALTSRILFDSLFFRAGWRHYYWGNYYGGAYAGLGFRPWFGIGAGAGFYDPLWSYNRWYYRNDPLWAAGLRTTFDGRTAGRLPVPPRTVAAAGGANTAPSAVTPLKDVAKTGGVKLEKVAAPQQQAFRQNAQQMVNRSVEQSRIASQARVNVGGSIPSNVKIGSGGGTPIPSVPRINSGGGTPIPSVPRINAGGGSPAPGNVVGPGRGNVGPVNQPSFNPPVNRPQFNPPVNRPSMPTGGGGGRGIGGGGGGGGAPKGGKR